MKQNRMQIVCLLVLVMSVWNFPVHAGNTGLQDVSAKMCGDGESALRPEWMKSLHDSLPVCKISIPGTHDSGAVRGGQMLKTQSTDISAQLQQGIRAFDIRLKKKNGKLGVFHSRAFQGIYWEDDVLSAFIDFLQAHPSEILIVSLKREGGTGLCFSTVCFFECPCTSALFCGGFSSGTDIGGLPGEDSFSAQRLCNG